MFICTVKTTAQQHKILSLEGLFLVQMTHFLMISFVTIIYAILVLEVIGLLLDRKGATLQNPYLKIYHKSIELNFNSKEFKDEYLAEIDLSNIIRVEFTIKSMKHLRKFKIESQKLIDLLNLSQNIKSAMLKDIINTHLMSRIVKAEKPIGKISPTGVVFYNALNIISKRTYMNKNMIIDSMLENIKNKTAKSRKKKKLNEIWNTYIQMQEHNKKKEKMISLFDAICW